MEAENPVTAWYLKKRRYFSFAIKVFLSFHVHKEFKKKLDKIEASMAIRLEIS